MALRHRHAIVWLHCALFQFSVHFSVHSPQPVYGETKNVLGLTKATTNASKSDQSKPILKHPVTGTTGNDREYIDEPAGDPATTPLAKAKPWTPGWCRWDWRASWLAQHEAMVDQSQRNEYDIIFLGDSLTKGWQKRLANRYAPLRTANFGIGGDSTRQILWRVKHGVLDAITPRLIVLMIGTNNLYDDANGGTDEEIAKGIEACVKLLREKCPSSQILLLSILPRQNHHFCSRISAINSLIKGLGKKRNVHLHDMSSQFLNDSGGIRPDLFQADRLHLSKNGYKVWGECMESPVQKLLAIAGSKEENP